MKRALIAVLCVLALGAGVARADEGARIRKRIDKARRLFDDLEYRKAVRTVAPIPHDPAATRKQRVHALELIGLSYLILGEQTRAREAFQDLLAIDPGYQLRDDSGSPKIREFFDDVKNKYVPGFDPNAVAELELTAPPGATAGGRLELEVRVKEGGGRVKEMVVMWRRRGELDYADQPFRRIKGDLWRARFRLPRAQREYGIDYYIEARDIAGGAIGRSGGPETPLALAVGAGGAAPTPWYRRWYVLAGGVVLTGVGTTLLITSGDSAPQGSLEPGKIELTPR